MKKDEPNKCEKILNQYKVSSEKLKFRLISKMHCKILIQILGSQKYAHTNCFKKDSKFWNPSLGIYSREQLKNVFTLCNTKLGNQYMLYNEKSYCCCRPFERKDVS